MAFEVYVARTQGGAVVRGRTMINSAGRARFHIDDLTAVDIGTHATILVDESTKRVAVRAPRENGGLVDPAAPVKAAKRGGSAGINLGGAIGRLGLDRKQVKGTREVHVKDSMLVIEFGLDGESKPRGRKAKP